ncbi:MAG: hypothetical protein FJ288_12310 [Planctomycetes bacterium]|nr:hypothetical protein [Planctomycetota bacterium]
MEKTGAILKKNQVRAAGSRPIGDAQAARSAPAAPQARLVEKNDSSAVIEVRCACGRCTYIQCRWPAKPAGAPQP